MKNLALIILAIKPLLTQAGPIYSSNCEIESQIDSPTNSNGFYMSNDCKTAFVLPPNRGTTTVVGKTIGELGRCREISSFNKALSTLNGEMNSALTSKLSAQEIKLITEKRKLILSEFNEISNVLGASLELNFSTDVGENLKNFQVLNPNLNVTFRPLGIKNAKITWNQSNAINPEMKVAFNQSLPITNLESVGMGSFNARLDLSLIGACPLRDPFDGQLPKKIKIRDVAGLITPNLTYQYEIGATYKYRAEFNLSALASKIKSSASTGGLFKTSSISKILETAETSGWFKFNSECDDARVCEQIKLETAHSIKIRLINEVLEQITLFKSGINFTTLELIKPPKNGLEAARESTKDCKSDFCKARNLYLDVGNAVFGETNQTDAFITKNNHIVVEEVAESRPVVFTGIMGFGE